MQPILETDNYDKESFCLSHENLKCLKNTWEEVYINALEINVP